MTAAEAIQAALARCLEYSMKVPSTSPTYVARINARLGQLYVIMADVNREYVGRDAVLALVAGAGDVSTLNPVPTRITDVFVENPGTSGYAANTTRVKLVGLDDPSELPPRATLRDGIISGWNDELDLVTSVRVYYARRPVVISALATAIDIRSPFEELIVIDLAKHMLQKTTGVEPKTKEATFQIFADEEKSWLADLGQHIRSYNYAEVSRHGSASVDRR